MNHLTKKQKQELMDNFGKRVIDYRDSNLKVCMCYATGKSVNPLKAKQYEILQNLSDEEREAVFDLLSETISIAIFNFLDMIEAYDDEMKLLLIKDGEEYDMASISEKMGAEIAFLDETGWIQKFSKIGRFVA